MVLTPQRVAVAHAGVVQGLMLVGMDCGSLAALDMSVSVRPTCREVERQMNKAPMVSVTWLGDHLKRVESAIILNPTNLIRRNGRGRTLLHLALISKDGHLAIKLIDLHVALGVALRLVVDDEGQSQIELAIVLGHQCVKRLLMVMEMTPSPHELDLGDGDVWHDNVQVRAMLRSIFSVHFVDTNILVPISSCRILVLWQI